MKRLIKKLFSGGLGMVCISLRWAAWSSIAGSLLTRYGWVHAGQASAQDWRLPLEIAGPAGNRTGFSLSQDTPQNESQRHFRQS
ncbi:MAG TPA: hypothetical protein VH639_18740 [Bryobacteraceae bacterium]|jgi:hypothetical protein